MNRPGESRRAAEALFFRGRLIIKLPQQVCFSKLVQLDSGCRANPEKFAAEGKQFKQAHPYAPATDVCPDKVQKLLE